MNVRRHMPGLAMFALLAPLAQAASDLSVAVMTRPQSGCSLGNSESVAIQLFNHGDALAAGTRVVLSYSINAAPAVNETLSLAYTLLPDSGLAYTFDTRADLSLPASYSIDASVRVADDVNPANDAIHGHEVSNWAASEGGEVRGPERAGSGTLAISAQVGRVIDWEESTDGGTRWQPLGNPLPQYEFDGLLRRTLFRVEVRNGGCSPAYSSEFSVEPG